MTKGLDRFKTHFKNFKNQYVLIGGSACWVVLNQAGLPFRPTRDLDIVLMIETLSQEFSDAFHEFIREGEYEIQTKSNGFPCFYRFAKPKKQDYPLQIEILSRKNELDHSFLPGSITRMSIDEEVISLSAIIMNDEMYYFLKHNAIIIDDISVADEHCLIPLKVRAWMDLSEKKAQGNRIKSEDIVKHKNDVYRLSQLLIPRKLSQVPPLIKADIQFFAEYNVDNDDLLHRIGIENTSIKQILDLLKAVYLE